MFQTKRSVRCSRECIRLFLFSVLLAGLPTPADAQTTVTDIDGNVYSTVRIGDQLWMAANLRTSRYADGTDIPNVTVNAQWAGLSTGAWAHYNNDSSNEAVYGKLYNWHAVADAAGLCPQGWRVPTDAEWTQLSDFLGGASAAGGKMKATWTEHWLSPNTGGTNESGFNGFPGGYRIDYSGMFTGMQLFAYFWSSTEFNSTSAWHRYLIYIVSDLERSNYNEKTSGFSVRCLGELDSPPTLSLADAQADSITASSASVSSEVLADGGSAVTRRGVVWGVSADPDLRANAGVADAAEAGTGAFTVAISGLSPSTSYHARAFAINATDTAYSASVGFATVADVISGRPVTDIDGNVYKTVRIGDQLWMAENLRTSRYADGAAIANVMDDLDWAGLSTGAWAHYGNESKEDSVYGKLYNWYAVDDSRGLCPVGWRVPSNAEWTQLSDFLGGESVAGGKMKATETEQWAQPNVGATNESGFNARPGGSRVVYYYISYYGNFMDKGGSAHFWSSNSEGGEAWSRTLNYDSYDLAKHYYHDVRNGLSVRCLGELDFSVLSLADAQADSITSSSASVSSEVLADGGSTVTRRGVVWGESADPDLTDNAGVADAAEAGTGAFSVAVTGLSPSTSYHARAFAINATDTAYSASVNFTTFTEVTVTDIDGNMYNTVQIGDQLWMAENLRTSRYADGAAIAQEGYDAYWEDLTIGAWAHYNDDLSNESVYGKLYNGYAVADAAGLCPEGWHVPTIEEWTRLQDVLGGNSVAGGKMKATGTEYWRTPNEGATNESGFNARPGGYRNSLGTFNFIETYAYFWSSSDIGPNDAWYLGLNYSSSNANQYNDDKRSGFSVRCLRDIAPSTLSIADVLVGPTGTASVDVMLTGFAEKDSLVSYQFQLPLLDGISVDSVSMLATLSGDAGGALTQNVLPVNGQNTLFVAYATDGFLTPGDKPLVRLHLKLDPEVEGELRPEQVYFNEMEVTDVNAGSISRIIYGDVDGSGSVFAYDAAVLLHYLVGRNLLHEEDPLPWVAARLDAADVDGDGQLLAMDASWILKYVVKLVSDWPAATLAKAPAAPEVGVRSTGEEVVFSAAAGGLTAFQVELPIVPGLRYGEPVSVTGRESQSADGGNGQGALLVFNEDAEAGVLRIALAGVESAQGEFLRVPYSLDLGVLDPGALDPESLDGARTLALEIPAVANTEARTLGVELAASGTGVSTEPDGGDIGLPERFELRANYPNPFNPATQLSFALPQASEVRLEVFDAAGRRVAVLAEGMRPAGVHRVTFEAGALSSGVYIARLTAPGFVQSRAMVLLK